MTAITKEELKDLLLRCYESREEKNTNNIIFEINLSVEELIDRLLHCNALDLYEAEIVRNQIRAEMPLFEKNYLKTREILKNYSFEKLTLNHIIQIFTCYLLADQGLASTRCQQFINDNKDILYPVINELKPLLFYFFKITIQYGYYPDDLFEIMDMDSLKKILEENRDTGILDLRQLGCAPIPFYSKHFSSYKAIFVSPKNKNSNTKDEKKTNKKNLSSKNKDEKQTYTYIFDESDYFCNRVDLYVKFIFSCYYNLMFNEEQDNALAIKHIFISDIGPPDLQEILDLFDKIPFENQDISLKGSFSGLDKIFNIYSNALFLSSYIKNGYCKKYDLNYIDKLARERLSVFARFGVNSLKDNDFYSRFAGLYLYRKKIELNVKHLGSNHKKFIKNFYGGNKENTTDSNKAITCAEDSVKLGWYVPKNKSKFEYEIVTSLLAMQGSLIEEINAIDIKNFCVE
ncbi:MAG: hypothetical protein LBQ84_08485 [Flavobacteriaceae bacterium]|jgi:hypothetical protein|nr:hypothetical protein [Flavobacteriaceae bacterium]